MGVCVSERSIIIVGIVPQTLAGNSDALSSHLADYSLYDDLVGGNRKNLDLLLNLAHDSLDLSLGLSLVVLLTLEVLLDDLLNDIADLGRVESKQGVSVGGGCLLTCLAP